MTMMISNYSITYIYIYIYIHIRQQPGECNSVITTGNDNGNVFTLQKSLLCDCPGQTFEPDVDPSSTVKPAITVDGVGTVLNLNGYTVECKPGAGIASNAINLAGTANTVVGPGTGEYAMVKNFFPYESIYILIQ